MINLNFEQQVLTPEYLENPYKYYQQLRSDDPVYWSDSVGAWIVTRYDDVIGGLRDKRLGSGERTKAYIKQLPETEQIELKSLSDHISTWVGFTDPPNHTRLRASIGNAFTSRMINGLLPRIQTITDELIDLVHSAGKMDVVADLAFPLPVIVICEMLGLPPEGRAQFKECSNLLVEFMGTGRPKIDVGIRTQESVLELKSYVETIFDERRHQPKNDLISRLVSVDSRDDVLTNDELFGMCVQLLMAGHETSMSLISNGLLALLHNTDQMEMLRANPELIGTAVEEFLRYDSPIQHQTRVANQDFEFRGKRIIKGQRVLLMLGAANRDPEQFEHPDKLDISRQPNRHVGFGYGIHFCIGAPLARLEGQVAINTILNRTVELHLMNKTLTWRRNLAQRQPDSLLLAFT